MNRILIVDDDQRIFQLLGDCFKHAYSVEVAMNGERRLRSCGGSVPILCCSTSCCQA
jgi:DNA-binding response OmpR family regulator